MFKICELWTVILWYELNPRLNFGYDFVQLVHFSWDTSCIKFAKSDIFLGPKSRILKFTCSEMALKIQPLG